MTKKTKKKLTPEEQEFVDTMVVADEMYDAVVAQISHPSAP